MNQTGYGLEFAPAIAYNAAMPWTVEQALAHWQKKQLLTKEQAAKLKAALGDADHFDQHGMPRAVTIFATVGAVLIGLGVVLFVGSNWADMTPFQRIATLFLGYGVVVAGAFVTEQRKLMRTSESLWLLTDILFGANIMLLAQIFHYSLTFWQGPFLWMVGALAMGLARQQKVHGYLAVPLGILALGWLDSGRGWGFGGQMEFLGSHDNLLPVLPLLGLSLASLSLLIRKERHCAFLHDALLNFGVLLVVVPFIISTADESIPEEIFAMGGTLKQWCIAAASLVLVLLACVKGMGRMEVRSYVLVLLLLSAVLLIQRQDTALIGYVFEQNAFLYFLYILVLFVLSLWGVWIGILVQNGRLVNAGIVAASIIIIIQYFSWSFALLDRSIAFILGGILLIAMTVGIERKRRKILSSFTAS